MNKFILKIKFDLCIYLGTLSPLRYKWNSPFQKISLSPPPLENSSAPHTTYRGGDCTLSPKTILFLITGMLSLKWWVLFSIEILVQYVPLRSPHGAPCFSSPFPCVWMWQSVDTWGVSSFEVLWVKIPWALRQLIYMLQFLLGNSYLKWDCSIIKTATHLPSQGAAGFQNGLYYFALFLPT